MDILYFYDAYCNSESYAGPISDETDNVVGRCVSQSETLTQLENKLSELQIMEVDVAGRIEGVRECITKEKRVRQLFSAFKLYITGVNSLNAMVINNLSPMIDPEAKEFHMRDYRYTPSEQVETAIINRIHTQLLEDCRTKIGTVSESFVVVYDTLSDGTVVEYYGGNQGWFASVPGWEYVNAAGCGVIASVNQYLYLTGRTRISKDEYINLVYDYLYARDYLSPVARDRLSADGTMHPLIAAGRQKAIPGPTGALPQQMTAYVENMCAWDGHLVFSSWDFMDDYEQDYRNMKSQLEKGIPVVWAVHDFDTVDDGDKTNDITFYKENNGVYTPDTTTNSHYITITAIYENPAEPDHRRMIEISSWGEKYYVDFDEYVEWAEKNEWNRPFSSITNTTVAW